MVKVVSQGAIGGTAEACHTLLCLSLRCVYATVRRSNGCIMAGVHVIRLISRRLATWKGTT